MDIWQKRNNAQIDQKNVLCKLGFDFTDAVRGDLVHQWFSKNQGLPSWNNSKKTRTSLNTRRNIATLKFTVDNIGPYNFNILTSLSHLLKEEEYDDRQGHIGLGKQHSKYITRREEGHFYLDWLTKKNTANFLFNVQHEEYKIKDFLKKSNPNNSMRDTFSLGLQDSLSLFNYSLIITPAFRYTFIQDELKSAPSIKGFSLEGLSKKRNYPSPQIGLKYSPHQWWTLKTNIARYTRVPSFFELFGDRGFFLGNEDLKTEKGINFDVGAEINYSTSNEMLKKIHFKAAYFSSKADDLITRVYDARGVGKSVNISQSKIKGVEASLNLYFFKMMRFVGNATWQDTKNLHQIKAFNLKKLPGRFEKSYLRKIEALYKIFKLYCEEKIEKNIYYDTANLLKGEDKREINAGISLLYHSFVFNFEAKNLGNERYEDFNGYPLPGRAYYCELKCTFR